MRTKYGVSKEFGVVIESPLRMAQKRKAARMKRDAQLAEKEDHDLRRTAASDVKSLVLRFHKGPWGMYAHYYRNNARIA